MKSLNRVTLIGNLGQDPEVKYMQSGDAVAQAAFLALVATHGGVAVLARSLDDLTPFLEMPA